MNKDGSGKKASTVLELETLAKNRGPAEAFKNPGSITYFAIGKSYADFYSNKTNTVHGCSGIFHQSGLPPWMAPLR